MSMNTNDSKQSILIIDDNKDFLEIFSLKLTRAGFDVVTVNSGQQGIDKARSMKPDLILLDVEMPIMNGVETLQKLKADPITALCKVAFLTNYGDPSKDASWLDEKFAREAGAMDYLKKSEDPDTIVKEVIRLLNG